MNKISTFLVVLFSLCFTTGYSQSTITLSEGTIVKVKLDEALNSKTSKLGDIVNLEISDDVEVQGLHILRKGSLVKGTINKVKPAAIAGQKGVLDFTVDYVMDLNGKKIKLRSTSTNVVKSSTSGVITGALLLSPLLVFVKGKNINFERGKEFTVFVDKDYEYNVNGLNISNFRYSDQDSNDQTENNKPELAATITQEKTESSLEAGLFNTKNTMVQTRTLQTNNQQALGKISMSQEKSDVDVNIPTSKIINYHTYALIIGNEDYSSFQPNLGSEVNVAFAVNDATVFKKYCVSALGVPEINIKFLSNATLGRMNQAISWMNIIIEKEAGDANVIVYYAGHGLPDEQTHESYIMPVDVSGDDMKSAIHLKDLYAKLIQFPAKKITVFLDACFSGGARNQGLVAARGVRVKPKEDILKGNLVVFTSSSGEQSSLPYNNEQHGMFTYYLLKKLQESNGSVSYSELFGYLKRQVDLNCVKINSKEQTPNLLISNDLADKWMGFKLK